MRAEYVLDYDVISTARERRLYLLARIESPGLTGGSARPALNLSVVLDRSGSMAGDKLMYVKRAAEFLVQHLAASDMFSLVTYDTNVAVDVPPGRVVYKDQIVQKIQQIVSGNSTNLSGGWLQGCGLVEANQADGQINRVLLLTDGLANVGVTDPERLAAMARAKRDEGITTTTMGVGMGFNEDLLRRMANEGGGAFYFIDNPDQAAHIFREELRDLLSVVGQNLNITLIPTGDVQWVSQYNSYPVEKAGRAVTFRMGDLFAEEVKMLLLELHIPALDTLGKVEVARLRFDYDELTENAAVHRQIELPILVNTVPPNEYTSHTPNDDVMRLMLMLNAARAREQAVRHADGKEWERAAGVLRAAAEAIATSAYADDAEFRQQSAMLLEEAIDMEFGAQRYDQYARKTHTTKAEYFSETRPLRASEAASLHARLKSSRSAAERSGAVPTILKFRREAYPLSGKVRVTIGRGAANDIIIDDPTVSEQHCQIVREDDLLFLEDLNSKNGTFANNGRVEGRFKLSAGDVMTVGAWFFMFDL
ncbi:MAG: VWA domain-containing protein [bacterium]|nr:VWA domain-containing protein [bacterium]